MKATLAILMLCGLVLFGIGPTPAVAAVGSSDTLVVPTTVDGDATTALRLTIMGDTSAAGVRQHSVYKLTRGEIYYLDATLSFDFDIVLVADGDGSNSTKPPVIAPAILSDGSTIDDYFHLYKNGTFKNIYFTHIRPDTSGYNWGAALSVESDSTKLVADNCVFDGFVYAVMNSAYFTNARVTNCEVRNGLHPTSWFAGSFFFSAIKTQCDSLVLVNNTFFNTGAYFLVLEEPWNFVRIEHNTVFTNHVNPFYTPWLLNARVKSNVFFGTLAEGQRQEEIVGGWFDWDSQPSSTISYDTLPSSYGVSEADRFIHVDNNAYYWPSGMTSYWAARDTLTAPVWMNSRTSNMFSDNTTWASFEQSNNVNVDPSFSSGLVDTIVTALMSYVDMTRLNTLSDWCHYYNPNNDLFNTPWPLPENLSYSNTTLQTAGHDGYAVGDLNWFPTQKAAWLAAGGSDAVEETGKGDVAATYSLSQNYPNPFNPSTQITFTVSKQSQVSLRVFNVLGQEVASLVNGTMTAGNYTVTFNAGKLASGMYFYRLDAGNFSSVKKMMLLK